MTLPLARTLPESIDLLPDAAERGFRFLGARGDEVFFSFKELRAEALRRAAFLAARGLKKGDRVALVIPDPQEFVLSFAACTIAGLVPVPIYPRATFKAIEGYHDTLAHILQSSGSRVLLTMEPVLPFVEPATARVPSLEHTLNVPNAFVGSAPAFQRPVVQPDDLCFLQYTSGSTSKPKGVMVSHDNLAANTSAFLGPAGVDRQASDVAVSWLPLFHDMGLIGFVLGALYCDINVCLLPTEVFARRPRTWLEAITKYKGTLTFAPNFAYALAVKRVKEADLTDLDLSSLRLAGCGAEPVHAGTLRAFSDRFASAGFRQEAFLPSYGMAEATLAITFPPHDEVPLYDRVDGDAMEAGKATPATDSSGKVLELVGCGTPFPEHTVRIVDKNGAELGERQIGEILVRGPSITAGYFNQAEATAESFRGGWLHSGDLGYQAEGQLFICGRLKNLIIIRGRNFYPQDIEWTAGSVEGVRRGNVIAFSVNRNQEEQLIVCVEGNRADGEGIQKAVRLAVTEVHGVTVSEVVVCPIGSLPKTSSGKVQRRRAKALFEAGAMIAEEA